MRSRKREFVFVVWLFTLIIAALCYTSYESMVVLGAARAFVGGEGLWSKRQKDAACDLTRYAASRDEADFEAYRRDIAVPLADRVARLELDKPRPDVAVERRGLIEGKNHPDDVDAMIMLFRRFRHVGYIDRAIGIWAAGDDKIAQLTAVGEQLHAEIAAGNPDPTRIRADVSELRRINDDLTLLEDEFSSTLGEAARWVRWMLSLALLAVGAALVVFAGTVARIGLKRLSASEEDFRQLLEQAADGIFIVGPLGRFVVVNSQACAMLGYAAEELIRLGTEDIVDARVAPGGPIVPTDWRGGSPILEERALRRKDGTTLTAEITAKRLLDGRILAIARDVSERKRAEEAVRLSDEHVRQATKMEAIGRLAGGVAHDFNNLLTAVLGYSEILEADVPAASPARRAVEEIKKAGQRGAELTRQLLAFGRSQVLEPKVLDLNAIVVGQGELLRRILGEGIALSVLPSGAPIWIRADRGQIEQVILNLAINGHDAMPRGGTMIVRTRDVWVQAAERTRADLLAGGYALLEVRDTGSGMDAETKAHIFEPFFTTKSQDTRAGLGLAAVFGIVTQSGGAIAVESEPGRGSAFSVYFPRVEEPIVEREAIVSEPRVRAGQETILLAEDESSVRELLESLLRESGFHVLSASSGPEALSRAREFAGAVDLLVSDVIMPGMTGPDLYLQLATERPGLRALLISGYTDQALEPYGGIPPGAAFLQKPFPTDDLIREIRKLLDEV